ncbi:predicted protein [Streptomyces viridochromogenes DSM 40736]|uniref:Predicted protein n=1 Tax=Streptomyces viridochromogenes (strain DSM 40736 / JCM 4977 / BCRC 1201 / Tue 494) TaxID=591159 RepID=D9X7L4_STRVT|nr:predicted protein [Streptomyces viridochromogenes DSM 40736]
MSRGPQDGYGEAPDCTATPALPGARSSSDVTAPARSISRLEQFLPRLSRMAGDLPQLAEADFNPVLARPENITALDARIRLLKRRAHEPYLRRLR